MKVYFKKFLLVFGLLVLFVLISNFSYAQSEFQNLSSLAIKEDNLEKPVQFQKVWWSNLFPSYTMTDLDSTVRSSVSPRKIAKSSD
ncbi:MAG: hypothetical protein IJ867_08995 [Clostridia bacterium]|nr:hypothetical protein [Clostridia bacterium]